MTHSLQQSIQSVIDEGRIGSPVFLRCMAQAPIEATEVVEGIAALMALANAWMPSPPERIYAQESGDMTQLTAMVQYAGGQTAILSVNRSSACPEPSLDLVFVGVKGCIYHETPAGRHRLVTAPLTLSGGQHLIHSIRQAMETGEPFRITEG